MIQVQRYASLCMCLSLFLATPLAAQLKQGDVVGTLTGGLYKYHGELSDDFFGASGAISLQFAAHDRLMVEARLGIGEYRWKITNAKIARYPEYFGQGASIGSKYPGSLTTLESENESRVTTADFLVSYILVDNMPAIPFITVGVGLVNFAPSNSSEHSALPNNEAGIYSASVASIPLGGGLRIPFSRSVGMIIRGEYRLVFSEYLDDISRNGSNDALANVSIGLTYRFNSPRPAQKEKHGSNLCLVCGCGAPGHCCCVASPIPTPALATPPLAPLAPEPPPAPKPDTVIIQTPPPPPDTVRMKEELPKPVVAPPVKKRTSFAKDIRFKVSTDEFDFEQPETAKNLNELLTYMQESCEELQVMVEGHASADGPAQRNKDLSELRAQKVRQWLLEQGVAQSKIRGAVGYGSAMPRVKEPAPAKAKKMTKEELETIRRQNRRIEVAVLKECSL